MKKTMIILMLLAGMVIPAAAQMYQTSEGGNRSEHELRMDGGSQQWSLTPLSSRSYRSAGGQRGIGTVGGGGMISIGATAPQSIVGGAGMPQVQFGRGSIGGELVSDPTRTDPRRIGGGNQGGGDGPTNPVDPFATPVGEVPWLMLAGALLLYALIPIVTVRVRRRLACGCDDNRRVI